MLVLFAAFTLVACTITDDVGNTCAWNDALVDGKQRFCPQDDAPDRCLEIADAAALYAMICMGVTTDRDILEQQFEDGMLCEDAVVVLPEGDDCLDALHDRQCPVTDALPDECNGVVVSG